MIQLNEPVKKYSPINLYPCVVYFVVAKYQVKCCWDFFFKISYINIGYFLVVFGGKCMSSNVKRCIIWYIDIVDIDTLNSFNAVSYFS